MAFMRAKHTVTIRPWIGENAQGDIFGDPYDIKAYAVSPRSDVSSGSAEPNLPGRDMVIVGLVVYAPPGIPVTAWDRAIWKGEEYTIEGEVGDYTDGPIGWKPGVTFALKKVYG